MTMRHAGPKVSSRSTPKLTERHAGEHCPGAAALLVPLFRHPLVRHDGTDDVLVTWTQSLAGLDCAVSAYSVTIAHLTLNPFALTEIGDDGLHFLGRFMRRTPSTISANIGDSANFGRKPSANARKSAASCGVQIGHAHLSSPSVGKRSGR